MIGLAARLNVHVKLEKVDSETRAFDILACALPGPMYVYCEALEELRSQGWEIFELEVSGTAEVFSSSLIIKSSTVSSGFRGDGAPVSSCADPFSGSLDVDSASVHSSSSAREIARLERAILQADQAADRATAQVALETARADAATVRADAATVRADALVAKIASLSSRLAALKCIEDGAERFLRSTTCPVTPPETSPETPAQIATGTGTSNPYTASRDHTACQ